MSLLGKWYELTLFPRGIWVVARRGQSCEAQMVNNQLHLSMSTMLWCSHRSQKPFSSSRTKRILPVFVLMVHRPGMRAVWT